MLTSPDGLQFARCGWRIGTPRHSNSSPEAQPTVRRFRIWDAHSHLHSAPGDTPGARAWKCWFVAPTV